MRYNDKNDNLSQSGDTLAEENQRDIIESLKIVM